MPKTTFLDEEGIPKKSKTLYCFTPWEKYDKNKKLVFKCGLSFGKLDKRLESYYTSYPFGVIPLAILILPDAMSKAELAEAERLMFKLMSGKDGDGDPAKRLHSKSRVKQSNSDGGITEWFYGSEERIDWVFDKLLERFSQVKLHEYDYGAKIRDGYAAEKADPKTFVGEYFVNLGKIDFV